MKKIILFFLLTAFTSVNAQSVLLTPTKNTSYLPNQGGHFLGRRALGTPTNPQEANWYDVITASFAGFGFYNSTSTKNSASIDLIQNKTYTLNKIAFNNTPNNEVNKKERMSLNYIGIGINTQPLAKLHIAENSQPTNRYPRPGTQLLLENDTDTYLSMLSNQTSSIYLGYEADLPKGSIIYTASPSRDYMTFNISSTRLQMQSDGVIIGGYSNFNAEFCVSNDYRLSKKITKANTQQWNNLDLEGSSIIKGVCTGCNAANSIVISGFANGTEGKLVYIYADGAPIKLLHNSTSSVNVNRLILRSGVDMFVLGATFIYDDTTNVWRLIDYFN